MSPVDIRLALSSDLAALTALEILAFDEPWSEAAIVGELARSDGLVLVAKLADGTLAGFASFLRLPDAAELLRLAVAPSLRRQGVGAALLSAGLTALQRSSTSRCFLEVRSDNQAALALYQRLGFRLDGRRRRYYSDGCDALLLALPLSTPAA